MVLPGGGANRSEARRDEKKLNESLPERVRDAGAEGPSMSQSALSEAQGIVEDGGRSCVTKTESNERNSLDVSPNRDCLQHRAVRFAPGGARVDDDPAAQAASARLRHRPPARPRRAAGFLRGRRAGPPRCLAGRAPGLGLTARRRAASLRLASRRRALSPA